MVFGFWCFQVLAVFVFVVFGVWIVVLDGFGFWEFGCFWLCFLGVWVVFDVAIVDGICDLVCDMRLVIYDLRTDLGCAGRDL